ncbi:MacB family efflux pump subunit [Pelagicoccus albus]|uniref:Pyoverdine export ATP-binding/permease protein PvdT n=1 Tax=Pelagicoccus albus TaxID=415222 RepID=A0A7X1B7T0_9BACT|nr:MacB family efflux pump subunit [Pelagicoccus albus]MBC2607259.1 MacB family efflux pump subunit [Pelagicoccus albus]
MSQAPLIRIDNVSRHYESGDTVVKALDEVSLEIKKGEFIAIMGQSGSGKSTLMNILGCLDWPTSGSYQIKGREVSTLSRDELAELRRVTFGFIFQRYNLLAASTAEENVGIPALYAGLPRDDRKTRALDLLQRLGMGERSGHQPNQLSGGQQQRVAIARALMNDPPVVLADEPTGALDSQSGEEVIGLLKQLNEEGRTVILITHDEEVASHAKRIVRIRDGKIEEDTGNQSFKEGKANLAEDEDGLSNRKSSSHWLSGSAEAVSTALRALRSNLMRTALTLLGIVIGVASVITMLAIGNGSKQAVVDQISSMGTNLISVRPGAPGMRPSGDIATMTLADAEELEELSHVDAIVPERSGQATLRFGNADYQTSITGVSDAFPDARSWGIAKGAFFTDYDVSTYAPVIVLGKTVEDALFPNGEESLGQYILVGSIPFQVIGVMESKGAAPWGGDQDNTAWIPVTTGLTRLFGSNYLNSITVKIDDVVNVDAVEETLTSTLTALHGKQDFQVRNTASFLEMMSETQGTLTVLLGAIAAISLLVGGIGVMNIMLVSVTERTREIGIRMATGARMADIMLQFNLESAVVCTIGGAIGVGVGFLSGWGLQFLDMNILFSPGPVILAFTCAVATGWLFGFLPARKAANLDPVVALSFE